MLLQIENESGINKCFENWRETENVRVSDNPRKKMKMSWKHEGIEVKETMLLQIENGSELETQKCCGNWKKQKMYCGEK